MVDVTSEKCMETRLHRETTFTFEGGKSALYCKRHTDDGMLNVYLETSFHESCKKAPSHNTQRIKPAVYCK